MKETEEQKKLQIEADEILLEALVRSPAFHALQRLLRVERDQRYSQFLREKDTNQFYVLQGEVRGMNIVENLPRLIVERREMRLKGKEAKENFKPTVNMPKRKESPPMNGVSPQKQTVLETGKVT